MIYNGVAGRRSRSPNSGGPPRVGCIGRIAPEKGQRSSWRRPRMRAALPECRFAIYGAALFGDEGGALCRRGTPRPKVCRGVRGWSGRRRARASLDLLLVPSMGHEATPRVIPEAFAAGYR